MRFEGDDRLTSALAENEELRRRIANLEDAAEAPPAAREQPDQAGDLAAARKQIASLKLALHRSETQYRLIVESAVDYVIIAADLDGFITTWNEAARELTGWSSEQMLGRPIATIFTPEDVETGVHEREMRFSLTMGKARDDRWHMKADGSRFFASGEMMPLFGDDDRPMGFLKILRDRTRERAEHEELEASRERLRLALEASELVGTWDWDVTGDVIYVDARFARLFGLDSRVADEGAPLADFVAAIHPDDRERVGAGIESALRDAGPYAQEYRTIDADGASHWIFAQGRCFMNDAGAPIRFTGAIVDRTIEKVREARQAALLRLSDELADSVDFDQNVALKLLGTTLGVSRVGTASVDASEQFATIVDEWTAEGVTRLNGRFALERYGVDFVERLRSGFFTIDDTRSRAANTPSEHAFDEIGVAALINIAVVENRKVRLILYIHSNRPRAWIDEEIAFVREVINRIWAFAQRRRAEQAQMEAETRLRLAQESADIGTFDYDPQTGALDWDDRCRALFGVPSGTQVTLEGSFVAGLHPEDRERVKAAVAAVMAPDSDGEFNANYRTIGLADGALRHVHASGQTLVENGRTVRFVGAVRETTEEKLAEERQQLLTRELQHRVKNTLAMVNALANQTLRRAANVQDGLAAFSARLIALGQAHDILTQTSWTSAPIAAIVDNALKTHRPDDETRIAIAGPDLRLNARQSLALALGIHELATNAAKYGALSNDTGKVTVDWSLETSGGERHLTFVWSETGGPAVTPPASRGFGSRLIEQAMAAEFGGAVVMDWRAEGLVCRFESRLKDDLEDGGADLQS